MQLYATNCNVQETRGQTQALLGSGLEGLPQQVALSFSGERAPQVYLPAPHFTDELLWHSHCQREMGPLKCLQPNHQGRSRMEGSGAGQ